MEPWATQFGPWTYGLWLLEWSLRAFPTTPNIPRFYTVAYSTEHTRGSRTLEMWPVQIEMCCQTKKAQQIADGAQKHHKERSSLIIFILITGWDNIVGTLG